MSDKVREELIDLSARKRQSVKRGASSRHKEVLRRADYSRQADFQFMHRQAARKARIRRNRLILLGAFVLLVAAIIGIRSALILGSGADTFYEGVTIDGLLLKGYTKQQAIERLHQINQTRMDTMAVKLKFEDQEWTIESGKIEAYLDIEEQVEAAWKLGREGNILQRLNEIQQLKSAPYAVTTKMGYNEELLAAELAVIKSKVDIPAMDAQIDFDTTRTEKFRIIEEQAGREVPLDGLIRTAVAQLAAGITAPIQIEPAPVSPKVYAEDLALATTRIKRVTTSLGDSKAARIHNIKLALSKFNGMVIQPGEEVSFNKVTGPRGLEEGYQNAGVILDDEIVDGPGGGVCQVSTTLYQALVRSGLQIVKRTMHSLPVSYVPVGTDAAVAYDYKDLVFKNNTDSPVFLICEVVGTEVSVMVYGRPLEEGVEIRIVNDIYETIPAPEPELIQDTKGEYAKYTDETVERKKSRDGYRVRTYAVWYKDGEETRREKLTDDYYREVKGTSYVGVTSRPVNNPADTEPIVPVVN